MNADPLMTLREYLKLHHFVCEFGGVWDREGDKKAYPLVLTLAWEVWRLDERTDTLDI